RAEPVEALSFPAYIGRQGDPFDRLRANGAGVEVRALYSGGFMLIKFAAALLAAQPAPALPTAPPARAVEGLTPRLAEAPDYKDDAPWLCLPGRLDSCSRPLPTTALGPN